MGPVTGVLTQYGAVGLIALIAVMVARTLFQKWNASHDEEIVRLVAQAKAADERTVRAEAQRDRLAEELGRLNEKVRDEYVRNLERANQALADAGRDVAAVRSAANRRR